MEEMTTALSLYRGGKMGQSKRMTGVHARARPAPSTDRNEVQMQGA